MRSMMTIFVRSSHAYSFTIHSRSLWRGPGDREAPQEPVPGAAAGIHSGVFVCTWCVALFGQVYVLKLLV